MPRIHQLSPSVITKIAAGEVIERPASVVKELLENAVDAGACRIDVEVEQGGGELIRVVDDGCGIDADDLPLAFASHATSKLADADDLFRVASFGFRGEALASVGGVAQVTLQSRPADEPSGAEITCHGGTLSPVRAWNGAPGTRLEVRHLFYNTPVRRKFLRTVSTEVGHVAEMVTRLALSQPGLHLTLRHNGKAVYEVPAGKELLDRLTLFFGSDVSNQLYRIEVEQGPVRLHGYVADPGCERGTAKTQYLFVNGRWIRDRSLGHALQEGYRGLLMTGRYAVAFLFLEMPPDHLDVNVHPTKVEVRFRDSSALYHLVLSAVRERLRRANLTPRFRVTPEGLPEVGESRPTLLPEITVPSTQYSVLSTQYSVPPAPPPVVAASAPTAAPPASDAPPPAAEKVLQLYDSYIVVETPEGMLLIDQHALHERILFEHLKDRVRAGPLESQRLLIPEPVDLPADQTARVLEQRDALAELGLGVEDFGGGTVLVTSYPAILGNRPPHAVLQAVVDHLMTKDRVPTREQLLNDLLSLMACHAAVRAGDRLTPEQMSALLAQRHLAHDTHHCPHGRPTALLFSRHELERQFRRV